MIARTISSRLLNISATILLASALLPAGAQTVVKPGSAQAHIEAGDTFRASLNWKAALVEYQEAVKLGPAIPEAHGGLAWALSWKGDLDGAMREDREALRLNPNYAEGHNGLGGVLNQKGDLDGAIREYREAIRLDPTYIKPHYNLGIALANKGDFTGGLKECREAIRLKPQDPGAHSNLGWVLAMKGDWDGALAEYREAIRVRYDYYEAHRLVASVLDHKGDWDGVIKETLIAVKLQPDDSLSHYFLARGLEHKGDRKQALGEYRKAVELDPKNSAFRTNYGRVQSEVTFLPASWSPSMVFAFTVSSALVPSFLLLGFFRARDLYPEPGRVLWTTFILGVLIVYPVLFIDGMLEPIVQMFKEGSVSHALAEALFTAAIPEELMKFAVVVLYCSRNKEFREPMDGVVYGVVASLGFATFENVGYVTSYGLWTAIIRAVLSVPGHAFMGAVMGYFVGQWRFSTPKRWSTLLLAYVVPVTLHWLYDFPLMANRFVFLSYGIFVLEGIWALRLASRLRREQIQYARDIACKAAASEGAMDLVALIQGPDAPPKATLGWVMTLLGGLFATAGAFLSLLLAIGLSSDPAHQTAAVMLGFAIIGGIPLLIGLVLFIYGVKRIHASRRTVVPAPALRPMAASAGA